MLKEEEETKIGEKYSRGREYSRWVQLLTGEGIYSHLRSFSCRQKAVQ